MMNSGYLGWTMRLSIRAKKAYLGRLVVKSVEIMLHVSLVKVIFLLFRNLIISGSFSYRISYTFCRNLLFGTGNSSNTKLIQCVIIL